MAGNRKLANIGKAVDSAANGDFLGLNDSGGIFKDVQWDNITGKPTVLDSAATISLIDSAYVQARQTDVGIDSAAITSLVDSAYVQLRVSAGGLDSSLTTGLIDSAYISARVTSGLDSSGTLNLVDSDYISSRATASSGFSTFKYTATAGQTTFDSTDANGNTLSYTADGILVFYNGILMLPTYDYTATDGTSVVLTTGADSGSVITIGEWALGSSSSAGSYSSIDWGGDRGIVGGGGFGAGINNIDYWSITTQADAQDFGDLTQARAAPSATSSTTRGIFSGGQSSELGSGNASYANIIDYVTIASPGNATDFGDMTLVRSTTASAGNGTRGLIAGGWGITSPAQLNVIEYVTIDTTGNGTDFGDLTQTTYSAAGVANATYAAFAGGYSFSGGNTIVNIDYVTIASTGNASDFGDLTLARLRMGGCSDANRGVFGGGYITSPSSGGVNTIDYITIDTPGNATDFGDMLYNDDMITGCSNGTYGHFAGGYVPVAQQNTIQYITIQTASNSTDWADLAVSNYNRAASAGNPS
jgi:hypothetical protein